MSRPFEFSSRLRSFKFAFRGLRLVIQTQHNAWIHGVATVMMMVLGFAFRLSGPEWCWLILAAAAVWTAEALNTALEFLADAVTQERHPLIGKAKDAAAGAVLAAAIAALAIGLIVFCPHLAQLAR